MADREFNATQFAIQAIRADERGKVIAELRSRRAFDTLAEAYICALESGAAMKDGIWINGALAALASLLAPEGEGGERNAKVLSGDQQVNKTPHNLSTEGRDSTFVEADIGPDLVPTSPSSEPGYKTPYQRAVEAAKAALDGPAEPARAGDDEDMRLRDGLAVAWERLNEGRYGEARLVLERVLAGGYADPPSTSEERSAHG
jgi:hypothetical protein